MPQQNVCDLLKDQRFEGFLLVRSSDQRTGGNGAKYLDLNLADRTGEINAKVWDGNVPPPAPGTVVKVRGGTLEYNGRLQLRVERIRAMTPADGVDLSALTPCAPEPPETMLRELYDAVDAFESQPLRDLTRELLCRFDEKLRYYPAAQRIHHAERGGLLHHTTGMLRTARAVVGVYPWLNADLLYAGVILHDLCKTEEMISDSLGVVRDYSREGLLLASGIGGYTRSGSRQRSGHHRRTSVAASAHAAQPSWRSRVWQSAQAHVSRSRGASLGGPAGRPYERDVRRYGQGKARGVFRQNLVAGPSALPC